MKHFIQNFATTSLLLGAIATGSLIGLYHTSSAEKLSTLSDPIILALVSLLFFEVRFDTLLSATKHTRFLCLAWVANFILIPLIGWGIASLFLSGKPLLYTGLLIYFIAPCTDWFLGFTRLSKGNVALGSILLPLNLISQLLLFPVFLALFVGKTTGIHAPTIATNLWQWFLLPFIAAVLLHFILRKLLPPTSFEKLLRGTGALLPLIIAALVTSIFAGNVTTIAQQTTAFFIILTAVFCFFVATWFLGEILARHFKLAHPEHALLSMTTAARNAPLMLGLTTAAFPGQPLIYAALIIGMLVEFPHLTALKYLLLHRSPEKQITPQIPRPVG